jgi:hypothetical protein
MPQVIQDFTRRKCQDRRYQDEDFFVMTDLTALMS